VVAELLQVNALFRLRAAPGVLGVADQYGPERLEAACGKAVLVGDATYRTIKGILAAAAETDPPPAGTGDAGTAPRRSCTAPTMLFGDSTPDPFTNVVPLPTGQQRGLAHSSERQRPPAITSASRQAGGGWKQSGSWCSV
jgi:hypothetical protein